jgi:hypothetical protein
MIQASRAPEAFASAPRSDRSDGFFHGEGYARAAHDERAARYRRRPVRGGARPGRTRRVGRRRRGGYLGTKAAGSSMTVSLPHSLAWRFGQVTADGHLGKEVG